MEHTNEIAIKVLKERFSDYDRNSWHYDGEYRLITEALSEYEKSKKSESSHSSHGEVKYCRDGVRICDCMGLICSK